MRKVKKILLIDDDEISCWLHKTVLEEMKAAEHIELFHDCRQALDYISTTYLGMAERTDEVDLFFLDIRLPMMDGFQFLEELRTLQGIDRSKFIVIFLSTLVSQKDNDRAALAFNDVLYGILQKPLQEDVIKGLLATI